MNKPVIHIIASGGTIAGRAASSNDLIDYKAGDLSIEELIRAVPGAAELADIRGEQLCNIDSTNMTEEIWLSMARSVQQAVDDDDVTGVVITHGTDTMEETAYFLNLVIHTTKPVVLVGSMRPATAISADGPLNLLNAIRLASCSEAGRHGVLIAMNDQICGARDTTKTNTTHVDTFKSWELGYLGYFQNGIPAFYRASTRRHTDASDLYYPIASGLPPVWIIYCHVGMSAAIIKAAAQAHVQGLVIAGLGHGKIPANILSELHRLRHDNGIAVVRTSRTGNGIVSPSIEERNHGFVAGDNLSCQKAKILLQLALIQTQNPAKIQDIFDQY